MTNLYKLKVGQVLWFASRVRYRGSHEVTISKIGREWATLSSGERVNLETLSMDGCGYVSPGRCWLSRSECEVNEQVQKAWSALSQSFNNKYSAPAGCTLEAIQEASKLLKLGSEDVA